MNSMTMYTGSSSAHTPSSLRGGGGGQSHTPSGITTASNHPSSGFTTESNHPPSGITTESNHPPSGITTALPPYICKLRDDKVLAMSIPIAGEDVLGLPFRIPDNVVSTVLALALSHFPIYVSIIPLLLFHWEFWRLEEREKGGGRGGEGREKGGGEERGG